MIVRRPLVLLSASIALLLGAGCGGGGNSATVDETTDPLYQQALELKKQGRTGEALNAYLKVIERRGENGAPESHLDAGTLYLTWAKDQVEAYHHFSKYLQLQPVGPKSDMVRGQREVAKREFLRNLISPSNDQGLRVNSGEDVEQLRRRIQELEAENQTLRGASSVPVVRNAPVIALPDETAPAETVASAPPPVINTTPSSESTFVRGLGMPPSTTRNATTQSTPPRNASSAQPTPNRTQVMAAPQASADRVVTTPTRPGAPQRPTAAPSASARSHTVSGEKSLWAIARRYYGQKATSAQVQGIYLANRDIMRSDGDLRPGMVLRIP